MDYRALLAEVIKLANLLSLHAQLLDGTDIESQEAASGLEPVIDAALRVVGAYADATFAPFDDGVRYSLRTDIR
jgi:hypothetical protein